MFRHTQCGFLKRNPKKGKVQHRFELTVGMANRGKVHGQQETGGEGPDSEERFSYRPRPIRDSWHTPCAWSVACQPRAVAPDGATFVAATTGVGSEDYISLVRFNPDGTFAWPQDWNGSNVQEFAIGVALSPEGAYAYVLGRASDETRLDRYFSVGFDAVGNAYTRGISTGLSTGLRKVLIAKFADLCPGDFNGDGQTDTLDVLDFLNAWLTC